MAGFNGARQVLDSCRPAVHGRLRAAQGGQNCEVGLGELESTRGRQGTHLFPGWLAGKIKWTWGGHGYVLAVLGLGLGHGGALACPAGVGGLGTVAGPEVYRLETNLKSSGQFEKLTENSETDTMKVTKPPWLVDQLTKIITNKDTEVKHYIC